MENFDPYYPVEFIKTGIPGFDRLCGGGIPLGSQVLLYGMPGAGKTLFCIELLYHNAKLGIPSVFISTEERREDLIRNSLEVFSNFEDLDKFFQDKIINVEYLRGVDAIKSREEFEETLSRMGQIIKSNKAKIVVLDSVSNLRSRFRNDRTYTRAVAYISEFGRSLNVTGIATLEMLGKESNQKLGGLYTTSMFDGIVNLNLKDIGGEYQYVINIPKFRRTEHSTVTAPYMITSKGFDILVEGKGKLQQH